MLRKMSFIWQHRMQNKHFFLLHRCCLHFIRFSKFCTVFSLFNKPCYQKLDSSQNPRKLSMKLDATVNYQNPANLNKNHVTTLVFGPRCNLAKLGFLLLFFLLSWYLQYRCSHVQDALANALNLDEKKKYSPRMFFSDFVFSRKLHLAKIAPAIVLFLLSL